MANAQTQKVLDRIDADFDNSLHRLSPQTTLRRSHVGVSDKPLASVFRLLPKED